MRKLKPLSPGAIPAALEKALRYRLLNDPLEAESICRDVLAAQPDNEQALVTMLLAVTDLFDREFGAAYERAKSLLGRLSSEYDRAYYEGIIHERWAKSVAARDVPGHVVTGWFLHAMRSFERAESLAPPDNPDAILRFNTCVRLVERYGDRASFDTTMTHDVESEFGDEAPTAP
ncbi:MAG TPA: hypothetical protein VGX76_11145 [Pirellulales bacterium]|nr:hypothetical protein [Pirellulales bacterium]